MEWLSRTEVLLTSENIEKLQNSHVLVVGLGGVGAYAAEMICRAGVGQMTIIDGDTIEQTNINRQLPALHSTIGKAKSDLLAERLKDINPELKLTASYEYLKDERMHELLETKFDYVVDAIDTLSPKVFLASICVKNGINVVCSMGSGGKTDPSKVKIADVSKSFNCNLAKVFRKRLHKMGIYKGFKVVFSPEEVPESAIRRLDDFEKENQKSYVGTISYMPAVFGCFCASVVIRDLIGK